MSPLTSLLAGVRPSSTDEEFHTGVIEMNCQIGVKKEHSTHFSSPVEKLWQGEGKENLITVIMAGCK